MKGSADSMMVACTLSAFDGDETHCRWCNGVLRSTRMAWCSEDCAAAYRANHWWRTASGAAYARDDFKCVRCGRGVDEVAAAGHKGNSPIEVHHVVPVRGGHSRTGCHHHVDGLETLCGDCHHAAHHAASADQLAIGDGFPVGGAQVA